MTTSLASSNVCLTCNKCKYVYHNNTFVSNCASIVQDKMLLLIFISPSPAPPPPLQLIPIYPATANFYLHNYFSSQQRILFFWCVGFSIHLHFFKPNSLFFICYNTHLCLSLSLSLSLSLCFSFSPSLSLSVSLQLFLQQCACQ